MTRSVNPVPQYFDSAGDPLASGKMYYYASGTTTLKTTYADVSQTIANPNPVILTGDGRLPNVFFSGSVRQVLTDSDDVQIWDRDPVSGNVGISAFGDYSELLIYSSGDTVIGSDGLFYISIANNNQGNDPSASPEYWTEIRFLKTWNTNETYDIDIIVSGSDGNMYRSLIASNSGNNPVGDKNVNWEQLTGAYVEVALTEAATTLWTVGGEPEASLTLTASRVLDADDATIPAAGFIGTLRVIQGGSGSYTLTYSADFDFGYEGVPALSTAVGAEDVLSFRSNGTVWQFMGIRKGFA